MTTTDFELFKSFVKKTTFLTTALPYANGPLHVGHLYEAILADIYAKATGAVLISGDDQHGAAITLYTLKNKIDILDHIECQYREHTQQYQQLNVDFDYFGQTHSELHQKLVQHYYNQLKNNGYIFSKSTFSWFDEKAKQFLPDRYVRGACPGCRAPDIFPNVCEQCGLSFEAKDLLNPVSVISNCTPVLKETEHSFLNTTDFYAKLEKLLGQGLICESAKNKVQEPGLHLVTDFDITRDNPYFGIPVPEAKEQSFYVWFDAPIAYISFVLEYLQSLYREQFSNNLEFSQLLELIPLIKFKHVIGKDIVYFHTYFWLNLLNLLEDRPGVEKIQVHGWIVDDAGNKYSKSAGNSIDLTQFSAQQLDAIRLYFFCVYEEGIQDHNFSHAKAYELYNQFIVGKFVNIYSRISTIVETKLDCAIQEDVVDIQDQSFKIDAYLEKFEFKAAFFAVNDWLAVVNQYIQDNKPWKVENRADLNRICFNALYQFRLITKYIRIICPNLGQKLDKIDYSNIKKQRLSERIKTS